MTRTHRTGLLLAFLLAAAATTGAAQPPKVESVGITVSDLDAAVELFTGVLDFTAAGEPAEVSGPDLAHLVGVFGARARTRRVCLVAECLDLTEFLAPAGRPVPADSRSNDRWFQHVAIVVSDMETAYARVRAAGLTHVSTSPQRLPDWNPGAGGIVAFYFRDPDGHNLELISYPPGKGDPRWQAKDRLFLGIDHTAVGVGDTGKALAFWRDTLGLEVAGEGENWGIEQEHLNQVFGARLRITGLRGRGGPGVELLEYLSPANGRGPLADLAVNDLAHWHVRLEVADAEATARAARAAAATWTSPGEVTLPDRRLGFVTGALIRGPDGHGVLLTEP